MYQRVLLVIATILVFVACGSNAKSPVATQPSSSTAAKSPSAVASSTSPTLPPYTPTIEPSKFVAAITNPYFPLKPGTTLVYDGTRDDQPRHDEMTVTTETKVIMGVTCVVVRDVSTSNNAIVEKTTDWYAQDTTGNVWYFGEDTAEYTNGAVTSTAGTWMAGVDGALPGVVMNAAPHAGDAYRQEYRPGVAEDFAKVLQVDGTATTAAGSYAKVVVTEDSDLLDLTKLEHKSYAPNVGFVATDGMVNGHHEVRTLTKILTGG